MAWRCIGSGCLVVALLVSCGGRTGLSVGTDATDAATDATTTKPCQDGACDQHVFANSDTTLYDVRVPSGTVSTIGDTGLHLTDIALSAQSLLVGVSIEGISKVTPSSGFTSVILPIDGYMVSGADFAPDGTLFLMQGPSLLKLDLTSGAATLFGSLPPPFDSGGDLAFMGSRLLATASSAAGNDELLEIDPASGSSTVIGSIGYSCVWGLAPVKASLFGFTCEGRILSIDPQTAVATEITRVPLTFWGAASR